MSETTAIKLINPEQVIAEQAHAVLAARRLHQSLKAKVDASRNTWLIHNAAFLEATDHARAQVAEQEARLRSLALTVYSETGSKAPGLGVGIRVTTRLAYDPVAALEWASKKRLALQLDTKAFEKLAKAGACEYLVEWIEEPQATISSDLAAALGGE